MTTIGKLLAGISMVCVLAMLALVNDSLREAVNATPCLRTMYDVVGAFTALSLILTWGLAVYHWGSRFDVPPKERRLWGAIVILGAFVGSWIYWLGKVRQPSKSIPM